MFIGYCLQTFLSTVGCLLITVYRPVCQHWNVYQLLFTNLYVNSGMFTDYCLQTCMSTVGCLLVTVYRLVCQQWDVFWLLFILIQYVVYQLLFTVMHIKQNRIFTGYCLQSCIINTVGCVLITVYYLRAVYEHNWMVTVYKAVYQQ